MSESRQVLPEAEQTNESPDAAQEFEALLLYLKQSRGFDFTAYKPSTLMRRVQVRMQTVGMGSFADYLDYLQVDSNEFTRLFNTILINVTSFFRIPRPGSSSRATLFPACSQGWERGIQSGFGARAVPPGKRSTPLPCCWQRHWDGSSFANG